MAQEQHHEFPRVFWTANVTELFERAAYYSMASFVVIYLGQLGLGDYWPSQPQRRALDAGLLPADPLRARSPTRSASARSLLVAFVLLAVGYFLMGYPVWFGGATLVADRRTRRSPPARRGRAGRRCAILLIGVGGSVIKPCISGTVQKTAGARATLGFAIFYMVINIGSLFGRGMAFVVRSGSSVPTILAVVAICALAAAGLIFLVYRTTESGEDRRSVLDATLASPRWSSPPARDRLDLPRGAASASASSRRASPTSSPWPRSPRSWRSSSCCSSTASRRSRRHAGQAEALDRPHPARHGAGARATGASPCSCSSSTRLLLPLQPGLQRAAALREAGGRDEPGDGPLHRGQPVRDRLLPAADHARSSAR